MGFWPKVQIARDPIARIRPRWMSGPGTRSVCAGRHFGGRGRVFALVSTAPADYDGAMIRGHLEHTEQARAEWVTGARRQRVPLLVSATPASEESRA